MCYCSSEATLLVKRLPIFGRAVHQGRGTRHASAFTRPQQRKRIGTSPSAAFNRGLVLKRSNIRRAEGISNSGDCGFHHYRKRRRRGRGRVNRRRRMGADGKSVVEGMG